MLSWVMKMKKIIQFFTKESRRWHLIVSFCLGAILLSFLSVFQKAALGASPFAMKGFIVPVLFGGISGVIIGKHLIKIRRLNTRLQQRINTLESFLPICSNCKRIRKPRSDPKKMDSWEQIESYIGRHSDAVFSHGICPKCEEELYGNQEWYKK